VPLPLGGHVKVVIKICVTHILLVPPPLGGHVKVVIKIRTVTHIFVEEAQVRYV
jgi:hypothetical protein